MRVIHLLLAIAVATGSTVSLQAKIQSPNLALEKFQKIKSESNPIPGISDFELVHTVYSEQSPAFYIYTPANSDKGFVILSANDEKEVLLGYSPNGQFDYDRIPEALKFMASQSVSSNHISYVKEAAAVAPIIKTKWNQDAPYNNSMPRIFDKTCLVGCVGTAMSQLIKHHRFPQKPIGEAGFYWPSGMRNFFVDFSEYSFDFDNMLDDYMIGDPTETQIKAMNDLTYCCTAAIGSDWGTSVTVAKSQNIPAKMKSHFNYSEEACTINSKYFTISEWADILYSQLAKGLPVLISAQKLGGGTGHAFLCDGYDGNGYFHINWGWGGDYDGFYNIASLYTYDPDVDYSTEGWGSNQTAAINLYPSDQNIEPDIVCTANFFRLSLSNVTAKSFRVFCYHREMNSNREVKYGVKLTDRATGNSIYADKGDKNTIDAYSWGQDLPENLENGVYKVTPAILDCATNTWKDIYVTINSRNQYVKVEDNQILMVDPTPVDNIQIVNAQYPEAVFRDRDFSASADIFNPNDNEISAGIKIGICSKNEDGSFTPLTTDTNTLTNVKMAPGETCSVSLTYKDGYNRYDEERYICFLQYYEAGWDNLWTVIGEPIKMPITEYVAGELVLDSISIDREPTVSNPTLTLKSVFHCNDGYYNGDIYMTLVECDENGSLLEPVEHFISSGCQSSLAGIGTDRDDDFDKTPKSPVITVTRKPTPVKISRKVDNQVKEWTPDAGSGNNPPIPPRRYYTPVYSYHGSDGDFISILTMYILAAWLWDDDIESSSARELPADIDTTNQAIYYDLKGNALSGNPTSPGIYIKKYKGSNGKTEKIIKH